jgi:hypothetical protein
MWLILFFYLYFTQRVYIYKVYIFIYNPNCFSLKIFKYIRSINFKKRQRYEKNHLFIDLSPDST